MIIQAKQSNEAQLKDH